jgi:hypothetical protein
VDNSLSAWVWLSGKIADTRLRSFAPSLRWPLTAPFQALRAKFPNQLGGREPIVRRTDLGAKGIYYRAMVGPFASMEKAAGMCRTLKAAGGNCLVQRN